MTILDILFLILTTFSQKCITFFYTEEYAKYLVEDGSMSYCKSNNNNNNNNNCNEKKSDAALNDSFTPSIEKPKSLLMFVINSHVSKLISIEKYS